MSELTMSMFANSSEYWKARCENAEDQSAALKEENERLARELADEKLIVTQKSLHIHDIEGRLNNAEARVAELERFNAQLRSAGHLMANACYNMSHWGDQLPEGQADVLLELYEDWDMAIKEPANEG